MLKRVSSFFQASPFKLSQAFLMYSELRSSRQFYVACSQKAILLMRRTLAQWEALLNGNGEGKNDIIYLNDWHILSKNLWYDLFPAQTRRVILTLENGDVTIFPAFSGKQKRLGL